MFRLLIPAALLALLPAGAALAQYDMAPPPPLPAGTPAPAFTTQTVGGKPLSLRSLRGKVVLLGDVVRPVPGGDAHAGVSL